MYTLERRRALGILLLQLRLMVKKGIVISTVKERVPDLYWSNKKGVFRARLSAKFSTCESTKPKEFSATRKQPHTKPHTKLHTKVVQGEQGSS